MRSFILTRTHHTTQTCTKRTKTKRVKHSLKKSIQRQQQTHRPCTDRMAPAHIFRGWNFYSRFSIDINKFVYNNNWSRLLCLYNEWIFKKSTIGIGRNLKLFHWNFSRTIDLERTDQNINRKCINSQFISE